MLQLTPVVSSANIKKVRIILYDLIEVLCRGLNGLGVTVELYGSILVPVLLSKLPPDIKLIVSRKIEGDSWQLDKLLEVLKNEIFARERCSFINASATSGSGLTASATPFYPEQKSFHKKAPASASALFANERENQAHIVFSVNRVIFHQNVRLSQVYRRERRRTENFSAV